MKVRYIAAALILSISWLGCVPSQKIKDGKTAYDLKRFHTAIDLFKAELDHTSRKEDKARLYFFIAQAFGHINQYSNALDHYLLAEKFDYGPEASYLKAFTLKNLMRYQEASLVFESLKPIQSYSSIANRQAIICKSIQTEIDAAEKNISIQPFTTNNDFIHFSATHYDNDYLVFTGDGGDASGGIYEWTGRNFFDLYIAEKETGSITKFDNAVNSEVNDGTACFNSKGDIMIFTRCSSQSQPKADFCQLMMSKRINGLWQEPIKINLGSDDVNYMHPCLIENDSILIFAAQSKQKDDYDLYYAEWDGSTWSDPYPMPESINTSANELFPTSHHDTLYFSSDNQDGLGGLEIYKTYIQDQSWIKPKRLPYPFNTGGDDFGLIKEDVIIGQSNVLEEGFLSSNRNTEGIDKIYRYKKLKPAKKDSPEQNPNPKNELYDVYLALKVFARDQTQSLGSKTTKDAAMLANASIAIWSKGKLIVEGNSDKSGILLSKLSPDLDYEIRASKDSFLMAKLVFDTRNLQYNGNNIITIQKSIYLDRISKNKEIVLDNIYYDYDKWEIKEDAKPTLNQLADILINNPTIAIELGSHTDCRGNDQYNQELSQKRAESAVVYLLTKGINTQRIKSKGYGESTPYLNCDCSTCTEDQHQLNRRTSFKIL